MRAVPAGSLAGAGRPAGHSQATATPAEVEGAADLEVLAPTNDLNASSGSGDVVPKRRPGRPRLEEPSQEFLTRRAEIVAVAAAVFREKGYDAGTLDDVAEVLNLRRASLYYYVQSKAYLLYLIFQRAFDLVLHDVERLLAVEDPGERLKAIIRFQARIIAAESSLFSVLFDHRPRLEERYEEQIRLREREIFRAYHSAVKAAIDADLLAVHDPLYATQAIIGMATWTYKWFDPQQHDIDRFADNCIRMILGDTEVATSARNADDEDIILNDQLVLKTSSLRA